MSTQIVNENQTLFIIVAVMFFFLGVALIVFGNKISFWWNKLSLSITAKLKIITWKQYEEKMKSNEFNAFYKSFVIGLRISGVLLILVALYALVALLVSILR